MAYIQYSSGNSVLKTLDDWVTFTDITPPGFPVGAGITVVIPDKTNPDRVIAAGSVGNMRYSTDQGATWTTPGGDWSTLTSFNITELKSIAGDPDYVYGLTTKGLIASTNSGGSFNIITTPLGEAALDGHFISSSNGIVVGNNAGTGTPEIHSTTNSGATWTPIPIPAGATFDSVDCFYSGATIVIVSRIDKKIYYSNSGGAAWSDYAIDELGGGDFFSLKFFNTLEGLLGGFNNIWVKTTDGGATWTTITSNPAPDPSQVDANYGFWFESSSVIFRSHSDQKTTGNTFAEKSTDGGLTFSTINTFPDASDARDMDGIPPIYLLTNCQDASDTIVTNTDLSLYLGLTVKIDESLNACYSVALSDSLVAPTAVTVSEQFNDCPSCVLTLAAPVNYQSNFDTDVLSACTQLQITDTGNYTDATESGHALSDFSEFRQVTIQFPDGREYVYSSLPGYDDTISPASTGNNDIFYTFTDDDKDGLYTITICSVPTYNNTAEYDSGSDYVYFNGSFYQSLIDSNTGNQPDTSPTEWVEVELSGVSGKYCFSDKIAITCRCILPCKEKKVVAGVCVANENICNTDVLCKNKTLREAWLLIIALDSIQTNMDKRDFPQVEKAFNLANSICCC